MHLACGLSVGLTGLAAGYAIGVVGDMVCALGFIVSPTLTKLSGCSLLYATIKDFCWHDIDTYLWRSPRALWVCRLHQLTLVVRLDVLMKVA